MKANFHFIFLLENEKKYKRSIAYARQFCEAICSNYLLFTGFDCSKRKKNCQKK